MSIKINVSGFDVTVSDPAEAAALLRELGNTQKKPSAVVTNGTGAPVNVDIARKALRFLQAMNDAEGPQSTEAIMGALGVKSGNAVGGATKKINRLLADLGYRKHLVYRNPKKPRHPRTWSSGRDIELAIESLEEKIKDQK